MSQEVITLGGGCFWCTEAVFELVDGVTSVESGYSNGQVAKPSYEQVCSGRTGCVEVIRVNFDNERITSVASPAISIALTPVTLKANVNVHHGAVLQAKVGRLNARSIIVDANMKHHYISFITLSSLTSIRPHCYHPLTLLYMFITLQTSIMHDSQTSQPMPTKKIAPPHIVTLAATHQRSVAASVCAFPWLTCTPGV